jgi:DNA-binding CsgD family transcriptional regulator
MVLLEPVRRLDQPETLRRVGLTDRESQVTLAVVRGLATKELAARLRLSPHTARQHLKRVFEKTGVRSRRELVGKVFFAHYEPRLRDNERRAGHGRPVRGGPVPGPAGP